MKRLAALRYFLTDAWDEWRHSPGVNLLAASTLASALFVAGLVLLVLFNLGVRIERLRGDVRVEIYLDDDLPDDALEGIRSRLADDPGVARVEYVSKDEALRRFREWSGDQAGLIGDLDHNPLPASFDVYLRPGPEAREVARLIVAGYTGAPGVEEARFDERWLEDLESAVGVAKWAGAVFAMLIFGAVVFVMASVLRLAVYARRDEIDIMLLVGATPGFVRGPFVVAGIFQGVIASVIALALVEATRRLTLASSLPAAVGFLEVGRQPMPLSLSVLVVLGGCAIGAIGAFFAARTGVKSSFYVSRRGARVEEEPPGET